jgi:transglutaminase-like putative cysteine protease
VKVDMRAIQLDPPQTFHLPSWGRWTDAQRLAFLRDVATKAGLDPRIRDIALSTLRQAGVEGRDYEKQAGALLAWVQQNILYVNEPGEIIQDPLYTIRQRAGDCDDASTLLASLYEAIRLPWKFVLSGRDKRGVNHRYIEGDKPTPGVEWSHIYVQVGWPPFHPTTWRFAEGTMKTAGLGWDVVGSNGLPPGASPPMGALALVQKALGYFAAAAGPDDTTIKVTSGLALETIIGGIVIGVATSVLSTLILVHLRVGPYAKGGALTLANPRKNRRRGRRSR